MVSTVILGISGQLTLGVVRQANAAPASSPQDDQQIDDANETPIETLRRRYAEGEIDDEAFERRIETLRRRYAEGEIDDEAFERRLDQLIETEELEQQKTEGERVLE
ncbi:hypothetical protein C473_01879 [Halorubrum distributum JCM 10247]|uniref:SHOCT domain-containing protein n=1 Tax=Halorubrum distributum JCM 10247 TaxID=1227486 RepID=M0DQ17_9EURY|nr:hypothetical protein C473_01879 [Halorubrum terrestre JCM 10247]